MEDRTSNRSNDSLAAPVNGDAITADAEALLRSEPGSLAALSPAALGSDSDDFGEDLLGQNDELDELGMIPGFPRLRPVQISCGKRVAWGVAGSCMAISEATYYTFLIEAIYHYINGEHFLGDSQVPVILGNVDINRFIFAATLLPALAKIVPACVLNSTTSIRGNLSEKCWQMPSLTCSSMLTGAALFLIYFDVLLGSIIANPDAIGADMAVLFLGLAMVLVKTINDVFIAFLHQDGGLGIKAGGRAFSFRQQLMTTLHYDIWRHPSMLDSLEEGYCKYTQLIGGGFAGVFVGSLSADFF